MHSHYHKISPQNYGRIVVIFALLVMEQAGATVYYVSNAGSDGGDGKTPATAWHSLDKVNTAALLPGDSVVFERGGHWRGQLRPHSGDENAPITYGAYGSGAKPVLMGSVEKHHAVDWVEEAPNLWSTREPESIGPEILANPGFSQNAEGWHIYTENGASVRAGRDDREFAEAPGSFRIEGLATGKGSSDIQWYTTPFSVQSGRVYCLRFRAKCTVPIQLDAPSLMRSGPPWSRYATCTARAGFSLDSGWKSFSCYYSSSTMAEDARLTFFLGAILPMGAILHLDEVSLKECHSDTFFPNDVGNIIFNSGASCGVKVWEMKDLDVQGEYWYDEDRHALKLFSIGNPGSRYSAIECAIRDHIIDQTNCHHVVYESLACLYGAAHGIGGGSTHHTTTRDCDFGYIGGGDQMGGDKTVRFGNGVEFWGTAHDHLVEKCRFWEIYDAALTNQSNGPRTPQYNITYRHNVIWKFQYSFEYWNRPEQSETYNIRFEHNTCFNAGGGWGHAQRPDPSGRHLCFYTSPAKAHDIVIQNNIFCEALGNAFYAPKWPRAAIDALVMDHNCWFQSNGDMILFEQNRYPMGAFSSYQAEYGKEIHSLAADPKFVNGPNRDFHLQADSPCVDAGKKSGVESDIEGVSIPQGTGPDIGAYEHR